MTLSFVAELTQLPSALSLISAIAPIPASVALIQYFIQFTITLFSMINWIILQEVF